MIGRAAPRRQRTLAVVRRGKAVINVETRVVNDAMQDVTVGEDEVLAHCNTHMATFKAPRRVVFTGALPKNPSGKLLKRELRGSHGGRFNHTIDSTIHST